MLEDRLPSWAKNGHNDLIYRGHKLIRKYYDTSRVIKIRYTNTKGFIKEVKVHSDKEFELCIASEDE